MQASNGWLRFRDRFGSEGAIAFLPDENGNWFLQATHDATVHPQNIEWFTLGSGAGRSPWSVVQGPTQRITYTGVVDVSGTVLADRFCLANECRTDWSGVLGGGSGAFWQSEQAGRIHYDGRVGVGAGDQSLVSMLHVKAQSSVRPATQGLTIQGPQDAFQSQRAARLFMHDTDFRILRTTQSPDDGLTIRANGDIVAGRGLRVKGGATFDGAVKLTNATELNHSVERALTLDDDGNIRLATVSGAGGGGGGGPCPVVDLYYFETTETIPQSAGEDVTITYVSHVGAGAGSGGTFIGSFCAGPTLDERFDQQQRYENLRAARERAALTIDDRIRQFAWEDPDPWKDLRDWINALDEYGIRSPVYRQE